MMVIIMCFITVWWFQLVELNKINQCCMHRSMQRQEWPPILKKRIKKRKSCSLTRDLHEVVDKYVQPFWILGKLSMVVRIGSRCAKKEKKIVPYVEALVKLRINYFFHGRGLTEHSLSEKWPQNHDNSEVFTLVGLNTSGRGQITSLLSIAHMHICTTGQFWY